MSTELQDKGKPPAQALAEGEKRTGQHKSILTTYGHIQGLFLLIPPNPKPQRLWCRKQLQPSTKRAQVCAEP